MRLYTRLAGIMVLVVLLPAVPAAWMARRGAEPRSRPELGNRRGARIGDPPIARLLPAPAREPGGFAGTVARSRVSTRSRRRRDGPHPKVTSSTPASANTAARALRWLNRSRRKRTENSRIQSVEDCPRIPATLARVYFMPAIQRVSAK